MQISTKVPNFLIRLEYTAPRSSPPYLGRQRCANIRNRVLLRHIGGVGVVSPQMAALWASAESKVTGRSDGLNRLDRLLTLVTYLL